MGILGFGSLRGHFSTQSSVEAGRYAACLDVTSAVVHTIRNCDNVEQFRALFSRVLWTSRELRFLRGCPPQTLCYTLDNRAPRAKLQTQVQRMLDANSFLLRVSNAALASSEVTTSSDRDGRGEESTSTTTAIDASRLPQSRLSQRHLRIRHVLGVIRDVVLSREFHLASDAVLFDCTEGEGEVKGFRWLCTQRQCDDKLLMSRDNDVFVYALSTMQYLRANQRARFLIYHEGSERVLSCWDALLAKHRCKCWVLLLWLSICFGNDYAYGVLRRPSLDTDRCFGEILNAFARYRTRAFRENLFALSKRGGTSTKNGSYGASVRTDARAPESIVARYDFENARMTVSIAQLLEVRRHHREGDRVASDDTAVDDGVVDDTGDDDMRTSEPNAVEQRAATDAAELLTGAIAQLQSVLRSSYERGGVSTTPVATARSNEPTRAWRAHGRSLSSSAASAATETSVSVPRVDDASRLRGWIARQLWSFFYIMELPTAFTRNERFSLCPSIVVNQSFDKPFLSYEAFARLTVDQLNRSIRSVLLYGV